MKAAKENNQIQLISLHTTPFTMKRKVHPRSQFSKQEDEKLVSLFNQYGEDNWEDIANQMKNRNIRQCKERYFNYLAPNVKSCPWSQDEDDLLEKLYSDHGAKWVKIAKLIEGRTDINVKNRFLLLQRRKKRYEKKIEKKETENTLQKKNNLDNPIKTEISNISENHDECFFSAFYDEIVDSSCNIINEWDIYNFD